MQRELEQRDNDIQALRQKLEDICNLFIRLLLNTQVLSQMTASGPTRATNAVHPRASERYSTLRSDGADLPNIPLRPRRNTPASNTDSTPVGGTSTAPAQPTSASQVNFESPQLLEKIGEAVRGAILELNPQAKGRATRRKSHNTPWSDGIKAQQRKISDDQDSAWRVRCVDSRVSNC